MAIDTPETRTPEVVGELLYGNVTRYILASSIARKMTLDGAFSETVMDMSDWLEMPEERIRMHLKTFETLGLIERVSGVRKPGLGNVAKQYNAISDSPLWNTIGATMLAIDPQDDAPKVDPDIFGRAQSLAIQKALFARRCRPLIGMYVASVEPGNLFCASDFIGNDVEAVAVSTASKTLEEFLDLGMIEQVETPATSPRIDYTVTDSPLLETFRALSEITPLELQISSIGRPSARGLVVRS